MSTDQQTFQVEALTDQVELPNGFSYDEGEHVNLTLAQFEAIDVAAFGTLVRHRGTFIPMDANVRPSGSFVDVDWLTVLVDTEALVDGEEYVRVTIPDRGRPGVYEYASVYNIFVIGVGVLTGTDSTADIVLSAPIYNTSTHEAGAVAALGTPDNSTTVDSSSGGVQAMLGFTTDNFVYTDNTIAVGDDLIVTCENLTEFDSGKFHIIVSLIYTEA